MADPGRPPAGFLVTVPKRLVTVLDIAVEDGIEMVMSGGLVVRASLLGQPDASAQLPAPGESENCEPNVES